MSFSSDIKETLCREGGVRRRECENCRAACLAGIFIFAGRTDGSKIRFTTENEYVADYITDSIVDGFGGSIEYTKSARACQFFLDSKSDAATKILAWNANAAGCCKRAFLRGAFLGGGSVTDPKRAYHLEFKTRYESLANTLLNILTSNGIAAKLTSRKDAYTVYIKECEAIADALSCMGAPNGGLELFEVQIEKEMRNSINRRVNCETANADKMARAASRQLVSIKKIKAAGKWQSMPDTLKEIGELREKYPHISLKELGERLDEPIGKSGVNHRLTRIMEFADNL